MTSTAPRIIVTRPFAARESEKGPLVGRIGCRYGRPVEVDAPWGHRNSLEPVGSGR